MTGNIPLIVLATCLTGALTANIQISPGFKSLLVGIGNKQVLDCFVSSDQSAAALELTWTYPNAEKVNVTINSSSANHSILTIGNFTEEHAGNYTCTCSDSGNGEINKITILLHRVVEYKVEDIYFLGNLSATMSCTLDMLPQEVDATFQEWRKNEKTISKDKRFTDSGNGTLIITNPTRNDAGPYKARYIVTGEFGPYDCEVEYKAAPLVLDLDKSRNIVEGHDLDLTCLIKGYPLITVEWLKDGKTIMIEGDRVLKMKHNDIENTRLHIKSVKFSDRGNYTCEATGFVNKSSKSITVRIKDRFEWVWPVIGIICEAIVLAIIIFVCNKLKKKHHVD